MTHREMDCVSFLQWALPRMRMRWVGFRKVRKQVCKRIRRRTEQLGLSGFSAYKTYLEKESAEWEILDSLCIVTISRFYRDRRVFDVLRKVILPELAERTRSGNRPLQCWSAGCASGEEPYTLLLIWENEIAVPYPESNVVITATDIAPHMLQRAKRGCYDESSLRDLPGEWKRDAFDKSNGHYCIDRRYQQRIRFLQQDIREEMPEGPFDLVLCRNLVGYYYEKTLQVELYQKIYDLLMDTGVLVIGQQEEMPEEAEALYDTHRNMNFYRKRIPSGSAH